MWPLIYEWAAANPCSQVLLGLVYKSSEECKRIGGVLSIYQRASCSILGGWIPKISSGEENHDIEVILMCHEMMVSSEYLLAGSYIWKMLVCIVRYCIGVCYTTLY